jgi:hypothetical protein
MSDSLCSTQRFLRRARSVAVGTNTLCNVFVPTGTIAGWHNEHPVENILLTIFFVELNKRETRSHCARLPFVEIGDVLP